MSKAGKHEVDSSSVSTYVCILITYNVPYPVLGIVGDTVMNSLPTP